MKDNSEDDIQQFKSEKLEFAETSINTNNDNNLDNPTITPEKNQKEEALIVGGKYFLFNRLHFINNRGRFIHNSKIN